MMCGQCVAYRHEVAMNTDPETGPDDLAIMLTCMERFHPAQYADFLAAKERAEALNNGTPERG